MKRIACIGSRDIPPKTEGLMEQIGEYIASRGWYIASGNALGSDAAYARGANRVDPSKVILYLPWRTYNEELIVRGNRYTFDIRPEWEDTAKEFHPAWNKLTQGVRKLMARNAGIISRADKVIAYLNHSKSSGGGTGHGWRISGSKGIPRLDLATKEYNLDEIIEWLES